MEKVIKFLAALTAITLALAFTGCDSSDANTDSESSNTGSESGNTNTDSGTNDNNNNNNNADDDTLSVPEITLPKSVGENPFKGKTFSEERDYDFKLVFSDDGETIMELDLEPNPTPYYNEQYRCSVNADAKTLSWQLEKRGWKDGESYSFEEYTRREIEDMEAYYKETIKEETKKYITTMRKMVFSKVTTFSYTYDSAEGTLDLVEQFDVNCANFCLYDSHPSIRDADFDMYYGKGLISLYEKNGSQKTFASEDLSGSFKSEKKIVFTDIEDLQKEEERDTIIATYELSGSGSGTKLILSFMRGGEQYELTLDFDPEKFHLTEAK